MVRAVDALPAAVTDKPGLSRLGMGLAGLALLALASAINAAPGTLVIVGGGLQPDNSAVYRAFIEALPDPATSRIAVLPTASGEPAQSVAAFIRALGRHGVSEDRVTLVKLAIKDDPSTRTVDESKWSGNARSPTEIDKIESAGGIWMTGGDQRRLTMLLSPESGSETPMLKAVRDRLAAGAVVGGTSAGAAVMSDPMITGGDPLSSLTRKAGQPDDTTLTLGPGLGFFPVGLVDQHFGERARLGRLAVAIASRPNETRLGFGIDEDTALVVYLAAGQFNVAGRGNVTLLDGRKAGFSTVNGQFAALDLDLSVLSPGDSYRLADGTIVIDPSRKPTIGNEYYDDPPASGSGMAVPQPRLSRLLGSSLLDNSAATSLTRASFRDDGRAVVYRFEQTQDSAGYWGRDASDRSRYSIRSVRFSILPATATLQIIKKR
ncbi:MAG: cyanophycinase [Xanthomonadales bacterium]|nr:cyanophycinase [Xanthomonadales bacterium]